MSTRQPRMLGEEVAGSSLRILRASPGDPRIDELEFGDEPWEREIADEFQARLWEENRDLFLFVQDEVVVAAARLAFWNRAHPSRESEGRARYYLILSVGVDKRFQSQKDPIAGRTYAQVILDEIETRGRRREDCVGLALHVRDRNAKARHVYEKRGFKYDGEPFNEDGEVTLEMRLWFDE